MPVRRNDCRAYIFSVIVLRTSLARRSWFEVQSYSCSCSRTSCSYRNLCLSIWSTQSACRKRRLWSILPPENRGNGIYCHRCINHWLTASFDAHPRRVNAVYAILLHAYNSLRPRRFLGIHHLPKITNIPL